MHTSWQLHASSSCSVVLSVKRSTFVPLYGSQQQHRDQQQRWRGARQGAAAAPGPAAPTASPPAAAGTRLTGFGLELHNPAASALHFTGASSWFVEPAAVQAVPASRTTQRRSASASGARATLSQQQQQQQQRDFLQPSGAGAAVVGQQSRGSSSSSSSSTPPGSLLQPAVEDAIAAADAAAAVRGQVQQRQQHAGASGSNADAELAALLTSAADKLYRRRLRELHALLSPQGLQQLRLTRTQQASLQVVLADLQELQASWQAGGGLDAAAAAAAAADELTPEEAALVQQLTSGPVMPPDFGSYLLAFLPEGSGPQDVQQLLQDLHPGLLQDIQSVYNQLKEFEASDMDLPDVQARYMELSATIGAVAERVQETLAREGRRRSRRRRSSSSRPAVGIRPLRYSDLARGSSSSSSSSSTAAAVTPAPAVSSPSSPHVAAATSRSSSTTTADATTSTTTTTTSSSTSSITATTTSTRSSSAGWGAGWAKRRPARAVKDGAGRQPDVSGAQGGNTVLQHARPAQGRQEQQQLVGPQPAHPLPAKQQQQQPDAAASSQQVAAAAGTATAARPRRRRSVIVRPRPGGDGATD